MVRYKGKSFNTFPLGNLSQTLLLHSWLFCLLFRSQAAQGMGHRWFAISAEQQKPNLCWVSKAGKGVRWITPCCSTLKGQRHLILLSWTTAATYYHTYTVSKAAVLHRQLQYDVSDIRKKKRCLIMSITSI